MGEFAACIATQLLATGHCGKDTHFREIFTNTKLRFLSSWRSIARTPIRMRRCWRGCIANIPSVVSLFITFTPIRRKMPTPCENTMPIIWCRSRPCSTYIEDISRARPVRGLRQKRLSSVPTAKNYIADAWTTVLSTLARPASIPPRTTWARRSTPFCKANPCPTR